MAKRKIDEIRREEILQALIRVVAESGTSGASIRNVAKEADCSHAMITHYFGNKSELFIHGVEYVIKLYDHESPIKNAEKSATTTLRKFVRTYLSLASDGQSEIGSAWLEFCLLAKNDAQIRKGIDKALSRAEKSISHIVEIGIANGEFREVKPRKFARTLVAAMEGVNLLSSSSDVYSLRQGEELALDILENALIK